jgi:5-deoxy-glucuronate isomerase
VTGRHWPAGTLAVGPYACSVGPADAGWEFSGLRVLELPAGGTRAFDTGAEEILVLPLAGACRVDCDGEAAELAGRASVFGGPSDFAYLPTGSSATVSSVDGGRFALPSARAEHRLPFRTVPADKVAVELRGAGPASRQVHNFCTPDTFEADRIIACELLTPGGNWSSYPPHKHDEDRPGESVLEEIYYFEIAPGPDGTAGIGYQRVYGGTDLLAEVRSGDVVTVPSGWHGPSMAAPGYDLYYLNVMAGPGAERAWLIADDPAHAWIRDTWRDQQVDPRLPWGVHKSYEAAKAGQRTYWNEAGAQ